MLRRRLQGQRKMLESFSDINGTVKRRRIALEILGEIALLIIVGAFFVYLFVQSLGWPLGAALMPRIAVIVGFPFLIIRVIALVRGTAERQSQMQIMDMGFSIGIDPKGEAQRFLRVCTFIVGLYIAIWVFGFHVALPLAMFFYLFVYGRIGWTLSIAVSVFFLALIVGIYDTVLHVNWHEPLILRILPRLSM
jgi:hypothetical protein